MTFLTLSPDEKALMVQLLNDAESMLGRAMNQKERRKAHKAIRERVLAERMDKAAKMLTEPQRAAQEPGEGVNTYVWKPTRRR